MDNVERMFRHLVRVIRTRFPQYLSQPFDVAELYQNILPYRHHRRELGLETNEDYEITMLELLGGNHGYVVVDDRMREALRSELSSRNPDPGAFRQFPDGQVTLSQSALQRLDATPSAPAAGQPRGAPSAEPPRATGRASATRAAAPPAAAPAPAASRADRPSAATGGPRTSGGGAASKSDKTVTPEAGDRCRACNEALPVGRAITFCPHCGENLTRINCPACGSEMELGWRFCPVCGRPASAR
jgi:hypothetical protein